jgi:hypothetical protein
VLSATIGGGGVPRGNSAGHGTSLSLGGANLGSSLVAVDRPKSGRPKSGRTSSGRPKSRSKSGRARSGAKSGRSSKSGGKSARKSKSGKRNDSSSDSDSDSDRSSDGSSDSSSTGSDSEGHGEDNYGADDAEAHSGDSDAEKELTADDLIELDMQRSFKRTKVRVEERRLLTIFLSSPFNGLRAERDVFINRYLPLYGARLCTMDSSIVPRRLPCACE